MGNSRRPSCSGERQPPPATKLRLSRLLVLEQRIFRTSTKKNSFLLAMIDSVGVRTDQWRRPQPVGNNDNATPAEWMLSVPFQGFVYKVTTEKRTDGTRPYLADELKDGELGDLTIDLRAMRTQIFCVTGRWRRRRQQRIINMEQQMIWPLGRLRHCSTDVGDTFMQ